MKSVIVCLPGILARCKEQHAPLGLEDEAEKVEYLDYDRFSFNGQSEADRKAILVRAHLNQGHQVTLLGTSIGGDLAPFVAQSLIEDGVDVTNLKLVVIDAPAGIDSLIPAPSMPKLITSGFGHFAISTIGVVGKLVNTFGGGLPKDEEITVPSAAVMERLAGKTMNKIDWVKFVKQQARKGLLGHSPSQYAEQIQWMTKIFEDGSLEQAIKTTFNAGVSIKYVRCVEGNETIEQPMASNWWQASIGPNNHRDVEAPHCGYLQMRDQFAEKILPLVRW